MAELKLKILVRERGGLARRREIVTVSVPCRRGALRAEAALVACGPDGSLRPCQTRVLKEWPDGSVKWLLVDFEASVAAKATAEYLLTPLGQEAASPSFLSVGQGAEGWQVETGRATFRIDARRFRPFTSVTVGRRQLLNPEPGGVRLSLLDGREVGAEVEALTLEEAGPLRAVVRVVGRFREAEVNFSCRLHFYCGSSAVKIEHTLHNPAAARHSRGLWDLGDDGALLFRSLAFAFWGAESGSRTRCLPAPGEPPLEVPGTASFSLYQESSGGDNWRSAVHRNHQGRTRLARRGYLCELDGRELLAGRRATPLVWHGTDDSGMAAAVPAFWENFPGEIASGRGKIEIVPFPCRFPDLHELQGGEQKTHEFWIDFAAGGEGLAWALEPLAVQAAPELYRAAGIMADLPGEGDLVDALAGPDEFLAKRERADEYGWRNFGDIPADHEAVYHRGAETFVSHYNNQYDFIAGAYRKAFATGSESWRQLAAELARHVRDIDIYHTDRDREEYNGGLFWHTDHYLDAGACSHRSFSSQHLKVKPPHLCGGGPGAEHCYTSGLMLHYFQTGNPDFKEAVIALARWELLALGGPQTVLAAVKRGLGNLRSWRSGNGRRRLFPRYPLTRGTGNALNACLDAFELGGGRWFLDKAEELVRGALHPRDDIAARNLLEVEAHWSYTVLLVAVVKFLDKKLELGETGRGFAYARASLLAYADWMVEHEYPYLDKPEVLEYPNETWAAQDLRKSVIFYHAARFAASPARREAYAQKALYFYKSSEAELAKHQSSSYARPVTLVLQNGWVGSRLSGEIALQALPAAGSSAATGPSTPSFSLGAVAARMVADLARSLCQTSVAREVAWLRARLTD